MNFLHIDDHPMVRDGLALLLREIDKDKEIRVDHAGSCAEAIALAERSYDLIILDMNLPGVQGLDAVSAVREAFPATGSIPKRPLTRHTASRNLSARFSGAIGALARRPQESSNANLEIQRRSHGVRERSHRGGLR